MRLTFSKPKIDGVAGCVAVALLLWVGAGSRLGLAAQRIAPGTSHITQQSDQASPTDIDAARGALDRFLDTHPEIEMDVLRNAHRVSDPNYIREHPELQAFLESHPLVKADPRAFISPGPMNWRFLPSQRSGMDELLSSLFAFSVFAFCLLAVLWVLRLLLENRRWNKSFKVYEEVHTKLIEKFASGQELTAYMESDAGRRLLEWAPPPFENSRRGVPMPAGRILWSVQAGLILSLVGIGLLLIRNRISDGVQELLVFGTLGLTIGVGFIVSALISYGLSKHLGLIGRAPQTGTMPSSR
jgi:hypothetical protein